MQYYITPIVLGIILIVLGVINIRGNISTIHWYHRHRLSEENKKVFGKLVGCGTCIVGFSIVLFGIFSFIAQVTEIEFFTIVGAILVIVGCIVGISLTLYAIIKYNKGLF